MISQHATTRRDFLTRTLGATAAGLVVPQILSRGAHAAPNSDAVGIKSAFTHGRGTNSTIAWPWTRLPKRVSSTRD